jgi:hypothetical protein
MGLQLHLQLALARSLVQQANESMQEHLLFPVSAPVKMPEMPIAVVHALSLQTTVPDLALQPNWVSLQMSHPQ